MAEEAAQAEVAEAAPASGRRKNLVMIGVLVGVMVAEALVVFVLVKSFSRSANPQGAEAAAVDGVVPDEGEKAPVTVEVKLGDFRTQNRQGQQSYVVDFAVYATVPNMEQEAAEAAVAARSATIRDHLSRVVRSMDPERFAEPDLTTLRTQVKQELEKVFGPDLKFEQVLLTDFVCTMD